MKNKFVVSLISVGILCLCFSALTDTVRGAGEGTLGHTSEYGNSYYVSYRTTSTVTEKIVYESVTNPESDVILITSIHAYLKYVEASDEAKACVYDANGYVCESEELTINTNTFSWYTFRFLEGYPRVTSGSSVGICVYADAPSGTTTKNYIAIAQSGLGGSSKFHSENNYGVWDWSPAWSNLGTDFSLYCSYVTYLGVNALAVYNNTAHTSGKYETQYTSSGGWKVWMNFTGELPVFNHYENIGYASGTHEHNTGNGGYTVNSWANYTSDASVVVGGLGTYNFTYDCIWKSGLNKWWTYLNLTDCVDLYENTGFSTGTHEKEWRTVDSLMGGKSGHLYGDWWVWSNYTSDYEIQSPLDNVVECSWNGTNWYIDFKNPPSPMGESGWDMIGIPKNTNVPFTEVYVRNATNNYTFTDAVANGIMYPFVYGWMGTNYYIVLNSTFCAYQGYWIYYYDTSYSLWVNSTVSSGTTFDGNASGNWLWIAGLSLETGELGLLFVFILFILAFIVDRQDKEKSLWKPIMLFLDVPVSLATGIFYLGNTMFSVKWWVGLILISFAVILSLAGSYYALSFGRK